MLAEEELDPSAINLNIRTLLRSFSRCSYVAYTATPFANVLIDPSAYDMEGGNDLFPQQLHHLAPSATWRQLRRPGAAVRTRPAPGRCGYQHYGRAGCDRVRAGL